MIPLVVKPVDHLARDNMSGSGTCHNDVLAQPLSVPLRGEYNGVGGITTNADDQGFAPLKACLDQLAKDGRLYKLKSAEPVRCKKTPANFLEMLSSGDLLLMTPNPRKEWLTNLHKVYNESDNKGGFSHYLPQMKVDPTTLPDTLPLPLALNFVPVGLYDAMAKQMGAGPSFDDWNEKKQRVDKFDGTRGEQVMAAMTLDAAQKSKLQMLMAAVDNDLLNTVNSGEGTAAPMDAAELTHYVQYAFLRATCAKSYENANHVYFSPYGAESALAQAIAQDNASMREELAAFTLFSSSMNAMRKQWVPQTGNGSSSGLDNDVSRELYALTGQFMADTAQKNAPSI